MLMVLVVFSLPSRYDFWPFIPRSSAPSSSPPLLEWSGDRGVEKRLQWGVILLLGGGFALSNACEVSGTCQDLVQKAFSTKSVSLACI